MPAPRSLRLPERRTAAASRFRAAAEGPAGSDRSANRIAAAPAGRPAARSAPAPTAGSCAPRGSEAPVASRNRNKSTLRTSRDCPGTGSRSSSPATPPRRPRSRGGFPRPARQRTGLPSPPVGKHRAVRGRAAVSRERRKRVRSDPRAAARRRGSGSLSQPRPYSFPSPSPSPPTQQCSRAPIACKTGYLKLNSLFIFVPDQRSSAAYSGSYSDACPDRAPRLLISRGYSVSPPRRSGTRAPASFGARGCDWESRCFAATWRFVTTGGISLQPYSVVT